MAAAWQWSSSAGRERVSVQLDTPDQQARVIRDGEQSLLFELTPPVSGLSAQTPPSPGSLVGGLEPHDGGLRLNLTSPAFGFISTRPAPGRLVVEIFRDPLGARWRPEGGLGPARPPAEEPPAAVMAPPPGDPPVSTSPASGSSLPDRRPHGGAEEDPLPPPPGGNTAESRPPRAETAAPAPDPPSAIPGSTSEVIPDPETPLPPSPPTSQVSPAQPDPATAHAAASGNATAPASGRTSPPSATEDTDRPIARPLSETPTSVASDPSNVPDTPAVAASSLPPATETSRRAGEPSPVSPRPPDGNALSGGQPESPVPPAAAAPTQAAPASGSSPAAPQPVIRSRLNLSGPEAWPENHSLSTSLPSPSPTAGSTVNVVPPTEGSSSAQSPTDPRLPQTATVSGGAGSPPAGQRTPSPASSDQPDPSRVSVVPEANAGQPIDRSSGAPEAARSPSRSDDPAAHRDGSSSSGSGQPDVRQEDVAPPDKTKPAVQPIYVDEEGNPVPPPPDVPALLADMRDKMRRGLYPAALPTLATLQTVELDPAEREEVLYNIMTAKYESYRPSFEGHEEEVLQAANEAMNFNLDSPRVPDALSVLALVNLATGNLADGRGYVYLLHRKYPSSPNVPLAFLELGERQMERQEYADASISFQTILQEYPESRSTKDAARLQTYALYRQGHRQRAMTLVDFVVRRWPRIYLEDPDYLVMAADIQIGEDRLDDALRTYWTQYNLTPTAPEAATVLQRIAEVYYRQTRNEAAAKVLEELVRAFPQSPEAPQALLRLGENGLLPNNPDLDELFALFESPNPRLPGIYYQRILQEYPESPEAVTARLRTIAWQLWNREYLPAMNAARAFMIDYEDRPESLRSRDILLRGFSRELNVALAEENFERVLSLWERFPQVHDYYQPLERDLRVALARAQLNRGREAEGMELLAPFLDGPEDPDYGLYAYNLYLASYLRQQNWDGILALGEKVSGWELPDEARNQLDYAMALSAENLGLQGRALPLWRKLAPQEDLPLYQRAYASYFLARDAERRQDLRGAYQYNLDALGMFTQLEDDQSPYADSERVRESIAALMDVTEIAGRYAESLEWANRYAVFVPETSPDYAGLRFREARLHRKMGDMARWRAILRGIIDTEPDSVFGKMAASELRTQDVARDLTRFTGQ